MNRWHICLLITTLLTTQANAQGELIRIRTNHPVIAAALAEGDERSSTFARLTARIRRSDLIVYVLAADDMGPFDGLLQFAASAGNVRYVRIRVRVEPRAPTLIGLLAHELMHAAEIADAPDVRDNATLRALYSRIGCGAHGGRVDAFDSVAAVETGRQVLSELHAHPTTSAR